MKRKEEREKASKNRADQYSHPIKWNECYRHFKEGAEWADRTMIEKACKWIEYYNNNGGSLFDGWEDDFVKAMEE